MRHIWHDFNFLISVGLLVGAGAAIVSGIVADLWDLRTFVPHVLSGYAMTVLAVAHVGLNWRRLTRYARFRVRRGRHRAAGPPASDASVAPPDTDSFRPGWAVRPAELPGWAVRTLMSRRGFVGVIVGTVIGFAARHALARPVEVQPGTDLGILYHRWSAPGLGDLVAPLTDWGARPPRYKDYPGSPSSALPEPAPAPLGSYADIVQRRRSIRSFAGRALGLAELSSLLHQTAGITEPAGELRSAPSAGAQYPIELYVTVHDVEGLEPGVYHYGVERHTLDLLRPGDVRGEVVRHGLFQDFLGRANVVLYLSALFQRARWRYGERTYRYALLEAGHIGQNAYLAATAMGLGACGVGAFFDGEVNAMLGIDGEEEAAVYLLAVGAR